MNELRCIVCYDEFTLAQVTTVHECPGCGTTNAPMPIEWDVQPQVNWVELSLLCAIAHRFSEEHADLPDEFRTALGAVIERLSDQQPVDAALLALATSRRPTGAPN
jgi:hypothetical protein